MNGLLWLTEHDRIPTWLELDRFIKELGYRKPGELLSPEELLDAFGETLNENILNRDERLKVIAQAQYDKCMRGK